MLSVENAPLELFVWEQKMHQNVSRVPAITNPIHFQESVRNWWISLQPQWRGPLLATHHVPDDVDWGGLRVGGPSGIFLVIVCLSWWIPMDNSAHLISLIQDVTWVLRNSKASAKSGGVHSHDTAQGSRGTKRPSSGKEPNQCKRGRK
jgi:hypothetical protein